MAEDIVARYVLDVNDLKAQVKILEGEFNKLTAAETKSAKAGEDAFKKTEDSAGALNKKLNELGKQILSAFAVEKVIAFGKASFDAFGEAERGALKLKTAVSVNGGLGADFDKLMKQSEELQKRTIFSDDAIQSVQTTALQFGLTTSEVEKLIPIIADFASATGQDLNSALQVVIQGTNGAARGLKQYGVTIGENQSAQENFIQITDQLNSKFKDQAVLIAGTTTGTVAKLANAWDDVKESIGGFLATKTPLLEVLTAITDAFQSGFNPVKKEINDVFNGLDASTTNFANRYKKKAEQILINSGQGLGQLTAKTTEIVQNDIDKNQKFLLDAETETSKEYYRNKIELLNKIKTAIIGATKTETIDYKTLNKEQLEALAAQNNKFASDELERRKKANEKLLQEDKKKNEDQKKALEDLQKFASDFNQKALEDATKTEADKLNIQRASALEQAKIKREAAGGSKNTEAEKAYQEAILAINNDYNSLIATSKIKLLEETYSKQKDLADKNLVDIVKTEQENSKLIEDKKIELLKEAYLKKGDFSKSAEEKLQKEILAIQIQGIQERAMFEYNATTTALDQELAAYKENERLKQNESEDTANAQTTFETNVATKTDEINGKKRKAKLELDKAIIDSSGKATEALIANANKEGNNWINKQAEKIDKAQEVANKIFELSNQLLESDIKDKEDELKRVDDHYAELNTKNDEQFKNRLIGAGEYEKTKKALDEQRIASEKKISAEIKKLKQDEDRQKRTQAIFNIIIDTAQAIAKVSPNPFLIALAATLGAAQLATIIATPLPKYARGTKYLERGSNPSGVDTIPILANEGERIISTRQNKEYWSIYEAIDSGRFNDYMDKKFIVPALKRQALEYKQSESNNFASNIANNLVLNPNLFAEKIGAELEWRNRNGIKIVGMDTLIESLNKTNDPRKQ